MGPNRNPHWSTSGLRVTLSYLPFGIFKLFLNISCFPHDIAIQIYMYIFYSPPQKKTCSLYLKTYSLTHCTRDEWILFFPFWSDGVATHVYFSTGFVNYKKGALVLQPQVIMFTFCLPMIGGYLRLLWLLPPLKMVTMI